MALPYLRASLDSPRKHSFSAFPANFMANFRHRHVRREYHIVVLGAGGVGKSCLTAQFVQNIWIESYDPTIEDSYRKVLTVDGRPCLLEILDTAGTEQFNTPQTAPAKPATLLTTPTPPPLLFKPKPQLLDYFNCNGSNSQRSSVSRELYMKQGEGFLLVFSITSMSSLNELQELREQIIRIKDDEKVPIVIVGNKSDLEEDRAVSRSRAFALSQQWGNAPYYETSARRRANVDEAFIDLCRQIIRKDIRTNKDRDRDYGGSRKKEASGAADKRRNRRRTKMKTDCVIL
ncbi:Ras small monomeric GTPase [Trichophyton tonsurans CBS 112818]|uniref:Ras small monomeric GTPase n=1 Tax=Trichophyton tonsurans (strain CBS 112818) TaxID=647933 RepID=F2RNA6_TRIT1|nr:Ras small monomeric GTPase [Trichophyton tonsurans CBS 112818]